MVLHLIRHGKTAANDKGIYCGITDLPLSKAGVNELLMFNERSIYPEARLCFVSGLLRAVETMGLIYKNANYTIIEELREINFGDFEMQGYENLKCLPEYLNWLENPEIPPPNGESFNCFDNRVAAAFDKIMRLCSEKSVESACVVTHGGVIASYMKKNFENGSFYDWIPSCGRGWTVLLTCSGADYVRI